MSKLGSLYIRLGEPEGELLGGCCEIDDWAADEIERLKTEIALWKGNCDCGILATQKLEQQLAEVQKQIVMLRDALLKVGEYQTCYRKSECIDGGRYGKGVYEDELNNAMGGKPWQNCHCLPVEYFEALAATQDLSGLVLCDAVPFGKVVGELVYKARTT